MVSTAEQRRRWRRKYPEKVKEQKKKYLERKLLKSVSENPSNLDKLKKKLNQDFHVLTRILFRDELIRRCSDCGTTDESDDLQIHHKQYVYPIKKEDLVVLCKECHALEHRRIEKRFPPLPKCGETR